MSSIARYHQPERLRLWSCRVIITHYPGTDYQMQEIHLITPIIAKSEQHVMKLLWKHHRPWLVAKLQLGLKLRWKWDQRVEKLLKGVLEFEDHCLVWSQQDFVNDKILIESS